ncbi:ubiquitin-conjugating enzyme/RWD-like protein [Mycena olivaceomarginata]|nr:ubiquitin-conjugating enzyme/RWD-like protein [Mycena olivaceomarginata]
MTALRRIQKELTDIHKKPIEGILVETKEDNLFEWKCAIKAAVSFKMIAPSLCAFIFLKSDSPYKNGTFHFTLSLPQNFPFKAPTVTIQTRELHSADKETKVTFTTRIYHPGINEEGSICVPVLRDEWKPSVTLSSGRFKT